jgi:hypothetical protein
VTGFSIVYFSAADACDSLSAILFALESTTALLGLPCPSGFHHLCRLFFGLSTSEVRCRVLLVCRELRSPSFGLGIEIAQVFIFLAGAHHQGCFFSREAAWDARFQVCVLHDGFARFLFLLLLPAARVRQSTPRSALPKFAARVHTFLSQLIFARFLIVLCVDCNSNSSPS